MINIERIKQGARQSAEQVLADQEAVRVANHERWVREDLLSQARNAAFEQQKPRLQEQARQKHQARFQPLQGILNQLAEPLQAIRDEYFPCSPVFVVDHYEDPYQLGQERYYENSFFRALMVLDRTTIPDKTQRCLGVYAMAEEPKRRKFIKFGPYLDTRYYVGIGFHYTNPEDYWGRKFLQLATGVGEDMENVTPESDLFDIIQGGRISFASHYGTAPSLSHIKYDIGEPIQFRQEPGTFAAIEARFTDVLKLRELEVLRVTRG
ncbi:MAG: hypothetical protein Q8R11_00445 [bacterium]|nr:hypothetical protein [bacterium]